MKIHELQVEATPDRKRVGRGIGSGYGKTAGRGTKGQNARTGGGVRPGFEGGQNPLAKRLPKKRGFASLARVSYQPVDVAKLDRFKAGTTVDNIALEKAGLVKAADERIKLLGNAKLAHALTIRVQAVSVAARTAVTAGGGTIEITDLPKPRTAKIKETSTN